MHFTYCRFSMQLIVQAFIVMTVFMRTEMHHNTTEDGIIYVGILFGGLNTSLFNGYQELVWTVVRLPVFYKQRNIHLYPAWAYALPMLLLRIPVSIVESIIWTAMTYYTVGFDPSIYRSDSATALKSSNLQVNLQCICIHHHYLVNDNHCKIYDVSRMLKQILLFTLVSQMAYGKFRLVAAIGRDMVTTYTIESFADSMLLALGGFFMSRSMIPLLLHKLQLKP